MRTFFSISSVFLPAAIFGCGGNQVPAPLQGGSSSPSAVVVAENPQSTPQPAATTKLDEAPSLAAIPVLKEPSDDAVDVEAPRVQTQPTATCTPTGEHYASIAIPGPHNLSAAADPDVNIKLRGMAVTNGARELVDIPGPSDPQAMPPKLSTLFAPERVPGFSELYKIGVHGGIEAGTEHYGEIRPDWGEVHLVAFVVTAGESIRAPFSGYTPMPGYGTIVIYADDNSITLRYTPDDSIVNYYTLHLLQFCVDEALLALYRENNNAGRASLPALTPNQPIGKALGRPVIVSIRDTGMFMDPRAIRAWWQWPGHAF